MRVNEMTNRPRRWMLSAGVFGLTLAAGLLLLLGQMRVTAEPMADIDITKSAQTASAGPGDLLTYTIYLEDTGGAATLGPWMTDTLPSELIPITDSLTADWGTYGIQDGVITWTGSSLGSVWITFTAQISPDMGSGTIRNEVEVTGTGELITGFFDVQVLPGKLEASKQVAGSPVRPGEDLHYTVRITNTGGGVVQSAWMTDDLPSELSYAGNLNATTGSWGEAGDVITWSGALAPDEWAVVTFDAQVDPGLSDETVINNTAVLTGAGELVSADVGATAITTYTLRFPLIFHNYPPIPTLNSISLSAEGTYRVSWGAVSTSPAHDGYVLQEATDPNFTTGVHTYGRTTATYRDIVKDDVYGTVYYRVRVDDDNRWGNGPWSNVQSVYLGYYDNFDDPNSGWPDQAWFVYHSNSSGEDRFWRRRYLEGYYQIQVDSGGPWMWFIQPDAFAPYVPPTDKFCIQTTAKYYQIGWWDTAALIFGANEANTSLYMLALSYGNEMTWGLVHNPEYDFYKDKLTGSCITYHTGGSEHLDATGWNDLLVNVDGDKVTSVYLNGHSQLAEPVTMPGLSATTRVGVGAGVYEITPLDWRITHFKVIPDMECTP